MLEVRQIASDGSGSKFFGLGRAGSIFLLLGLGWVSHLCFGFGKFPLKITKISLFSLRIKKIFFGSGQKEPGLAPFLLRVKSMLGPGQGPSLQIAH